MAGQRYGQPVCRPAGWTASQPAASTVDFINGVYMYQEPLVPRPEDDEESSGEEDEEEED